jgi:putative ABC transport system permease protein
MPDILFSKIRADLGLLAGRITLLATALALAVAVLAATSSALTVLMREMSASYEDTFPATATFDFGTSVDPVWARALTGQHGVIASRAAGSFELRFRDPEGSSRSLVVFVSDDWQDGALAKVFPEWGSWPPPEGGIALERTAMKAFGLDKGGILDVRLPDGRSVPLRITTVVHDPAVAPAEQERCAYAYVAAPTAVGWGEAALHQLKVRFAQNLNDTQVRQAAVELATAIRTVGYQVRATQVPPVHRHPHQSILSTLLTILILFGAVALVLASLLTANAVAAFVARERQWIGVMKTVGARDGAILLNTLAPALVAGLAATAAGLPLGLLIGDKIVQAVASLLNLRVQSLAPEIPGWLLPLLAGLLVPPLVSLSPALRALGITIREALPGSSGDAGKSLRRRKGSRSRTSLPPLVAIGILNAFRKRGRLILCIALVGFGGALFMTSFNLASSWNGLLSQSASTRQYDFLLRFGSGSLTTESEREAVQAELRQTLPQISRIGIREARTVLPSQATGYAIESTYPDRAHGSFTLYRLPADYDFQVFKLTTGKLDRTTGEVTLNQNAVRFFPGIKPSEPVGLEVDGTSHEWRLAGMVNELGQAAAYIDLDDTCLSEADTRGFQPEFLLRLQAGASHAEAARQLETWMSRSQKPLVGFVDSNEYALAGSEHFAVLIGIIFLFGLVTGLVGVMGIASSAGIAATERRREHGIFRSVGGTGREIALSLVLEAGLISLAGGVAGILLSFPASLGLGAYLGELSARMPIPLQPDWPMSLAWALAAVCGGMIASLGAAIRAANLPVRENIISL